MNVSLKELMQEHDNKYIRASDVIKLIAEQTDSSPDIVIEYLTKHSCAGGFDINIYLKGLLNEYTLEGSLSECLINYMSVNIRPYTFAELEKEEEFLITYVLKDEIFNAEYIKRLNLNYANLGLSNVCKKQPCIISKELAAAKSQIADLKSQLSQAKAELADKPAGDNVKQNHLYNWQAMDKNQYPPELHLAIEIWQEYYQADAVEHITQFDSGRFNRISTKLNLSNGNLKSRIRSLLTPLESKLKSPSLIDSLREVDIIYTDKLEQD